MRIANDTLIDAPQSLASNFTSEGFWLGHIVNYSIQLTFSNNPNGTFSLECSNDKGNEDKGNGGWNSQGVTNWTTVGDSQQAVTASGDHTWTVENCGYRWVRVKFTRNSGSGQLDTARVNAKGV